MQMLGEDWLRTMKKYMHQISIFLASQFLFEYSASAASSVIPIFHKQKDVNRYQCQEIAALFCVKLTSTKFDFFSRVVLHFEIDLLDSHKTVLNHMHGILLQ